MLLSATVVTLATLLAVVSTILIVLACYQVTHNRGHKTSTQKPKKQPSTSEHFIREYSEETKQRYDPEFFLKAQENKFLRFNVFQEVEALMFGSCGLGKGEYLWKKSIKSDNITEEEWIEKHRKRGFEFEKRMEKKVREILKDHSLIQYTFQRQINPNNYPDMLIWWVGRNKNYLVIVECKHSGNEKSQTLGDKQVDAGLRQLRRYERELLKGTKYPERFSILLILLIDFPLWSENYPFLRHENMFIVNYICFEEFLWILDEICLFV